MSREDAENKIIELLVHHVSSKPLRVAIDGIDASGKTTLANSLASRLQGRGISVLRSSIDRFHHPAHVRYARGRDSPEGYYLDSFNYPALVTDLLAPLDRDGNRMVKLGVFDYRNNQPLDNPPQLVRDGTILIFDGVFLLRPELNSYWDYRIFVDVSFVVALKRGLARDQGSMGGSETILERYLTRYYPGQRIYLESVNPSDLADVIIVNNDFQNPVIAVKRRQSELNVEG